MSCVVQWWDVLFVKGMHFSSKNARLLNLYVFLRYAGFKLSDWLIKNFQPMRVLQTK